MPRFPRIAVINTGWSDDYRTGEVTGNFGYLAKGVGHEKYNFLPDDKGRFFAYTPPLGEQRSPPMPANKGNWLVFAVSKRPGRSGLYLVGWYESASFVKGYKNRPDADRFGEDSDGGKFSYTLYSDRAYAIPLPMRDRKIKGDHIKRSYAYLRGNGPSEAWREGVAKRLLGFRDEFLRRPTDSDAPEEEVRLQFCGDAKRRREIEEKAVAATKVHFAGWNCTSMEADKCGYDLLFAHPRTREVMHVEVKGTSRDRPHFFLTRREYGYARKLSRNDNRARKNRDGSYRPLWKLAVVHDVDRVHEVNVHTFQEMESNFDVAPFAWHATLRAA
jgi:hypothetical protein